MSWTSYETIAGRFSHIDARRVSASVSCGSEMAAELIVSFYPWWEHPSATQTVLDGEDYIIAEDFSIDVPEFIHLDSWFEPGA